MKTPPRHILPAALILSVLLHLLAYGSFLAFLGRPAEPVRAGEGESPAVFIEVGLVASAAAAPVPPAVPAWIPDPEIPVAAESEIEIATALLPKRDRAEEPAGEKPPGEADLSRAEESRDSGRSGRAGREPLTAGPAADDYLRRVRQRIEETTYYPRRARLSRLEGTVRIGFMIGPAGEMGGSQLLESSPHEIFNRAALDILERAGPFPPPASGIEGRLISVSISFESTY